MFRKSCLWTSPIVCCGAMLVWWVGRGGKFCISADLKTEKGSIEGVDWLFCRTRYSKLASIHLRALATTITSFSAAARINFPSGEKPTEFT